MKNLKAILSPISDSVEVITHVKKSCAGVGFETEITFLIDEIIHYDIVEAIKTVGFNDSTLTSIDAVVSIKKIRPFDIEKDYWLDPRLVITITGLGWSETLGEYLTKVVKQFKTQR